MAAHLLVTADHIPIINVLPSLMMCVITEEELNGREEKNNDTYPAEGG